MSASPRTSDRIDAAVAQTRMLDHPFYQAWTAGELSQETLREYAKQYFHHVDQFTRAVSAVHSNCPDRDGRRLLADNLAEEEGLAPGKTDHPTLWMQFAEGLGATSDEVLGVEINPETQALIDTFQRLSRKSYASGLAALYAYESQIPDVAATKIDGLKRFYGIDDARAIKFFTVHEAADVEHADVARALLDNLSGEERDEAVAAGRELAEALWGFLSGVERTAGLTSACVH